MDVNGSIDAVAASLQRPRRPLRFDAPNAHARHAQQLSACPQLSVPRSPLPTLSGQERTGYSQTRLPRFHAPTTCMPRSLALRNLHHNLTFANSTSSRPSWPSLRNSFSEPRRQTQNALPKANHHSRAAEKLFC